MARPTVAEINIMRASTNQLNPIIRHPGGQFEQQKDRAVNLGNHIISLLVYDGPAGQGWEKRSRITKGGEVWELRIHSGPEGRPSEELVIWPVLA